MKFQIEWTGLWTILLAFVIWRLFEFALKFDAQSKLANSARGRKDEEQVERVALLDEDGNDTGIDLLVPGNGTQQDEEEQDETVENAAAMQMLRSLASA